MEYSKKINMEGAIFFSTKYGSTEQYAKWIGEASGLPVFEVHKTEVDLSKYDFLVLGSPIIYYKPIIHKWIKRNIESIEKKQIIFFSVSGASAGPKLDRWIANSLPKSFVSKMRHVALQGRQIPSELRLFDRIMLKIAGYTNKDPVAKKQELQGFDFMNISSIEPILQLIQEFQGTKVHT